MKFKIEQVALAPKRPALAIALLTEMGAGEWARDLVKTRGRVWGFDAASNQAELAFEYDTLTNANELEVLHYVGGEHWLMADADHALVSHLGMHCDEAGLAYWREFFAARNIPVAQDVLTTEHQNPAIAGKRWYRYVIFATRAILGTDIKIIVRRDAAPDI